MQSTDSSVPKTLGRSMPRERMSLWQALLVTVLAHGSAGIAWLVIVTVADEVQDCAVEVVFDAPCEPESSGALDLAYGIGVLAWLVTAVAIPYRLRRGTGYTPLGLTFVWLVPATVAGLVAVYFSGSPT